MAANFSSLIYLNVSLRSNNVAGMIYSNARNEVEVIVNFVALDNIGRQIFLTEDQMRSSISLCDFYTGKPISDDGWNSALTAGDFVSDGILLDQASSYTAVTKKEKNVSSAMLKSGLAGYILPQSFTVWVSVGANIYSDKSIAVKIFDGDKTTYESTYRSDFESRVVLEPVAEKSYTMDDMFLSPDAYLEGGNSSETNKHSNFFSFINNSLAIKKIDGIPEYSDTFICTSFALWGPTSRYIYIDGMKSGQNGNYTAPNGEVIKYTKNERRGYLCFTLINFVHQGEVANYYEPIIFTVYDQYGNKGRFSAGINSMSAETIKIVITDA
ncbi:hypothetical protein [Citrobacter cronae]|uniref:hypothetical protein n=1 Tax=Citrobacter cronae TaxID=1748967 RepID=UPI0021D3C109|nr:hypothetical protein [Citrobacter cronae]MCU6173818.1 hypothetical protein [Citrobacter cronae]